MISDREVGLVVTNGPVSPVQQRNLEKLWKVKVLDRTGLILEIFGERDRTTMPRLIQEFRWKRVSIVGKGDNPLSAVYAGVVADEFIEIFVAARIAWVEPEAGDLVQADCPDEVIAHPRGAETRDAAAAFDATVELVDLVREVGIHPLLDARDVGIRVLHV